MALTLLEYKKKIYKQLGKYDASLAAFTDDEDLLARINDIVDKAVKFVFLGKSVPRAWKIVHGRPLNMIAQQDDICTHTDEDISFTVPKAYSYYFEVDDAAEVEISMNGAVTDTITQAALTGERAFAEHKGAITGADGSPVTITFKGDTMYNIQNVALWGAKFSDEDRIPDFDVWVPHAIPAGLHQVNRVYLNSGEGVPFRVAAGELLIRYDTVGEITVESTYFPDSITASTTDATEVDVPTDCESVIVDKACELATHKAQGYQDYLDDVDQGMTLLDRRPATVTARVTRLVDLG